MVETTLCYMKRNNEYLMLHRVKKQNDENAGKWIGVGGHLENGETPEGCVRREVFEETGLTLNSCRFRGIVDFYSDVWDDERMFLYTSDDVSGELQECNEGILKWVAEEDILSLNLWEGDRIFLSYLKKNIPLFHLALKYKGDALVSYKLYPRIVLASQSPRRLQLLKQIGIYPEVLPSDKPENAKAEEPSDLVKELSREKAEHVAEILLKGENAADDRDIYVIGADTVVSLDHKVMGKPKSHEEAAQMIRRIQGRTHQVYTGVTVLKLKHGEPNLDKGRRTLERESTYADKTDVRVVSMSENEIQRYALSDEPMDKAGAYGIQGAFAAFVDGIEGDYNTVVGLPVRLVYRIFKKMKAE